VAHQIRTDLESFANYGFPESHAWSFALIAYATAWLKQHHPAAFYAGLLNSWPMGFYPPSTLVHEAKRQGVEVRGPCLARGERDCTVEDGTGGAALRIGWRFIRGIGDRTLDAIEHARGARAFDSIEDLVRRARLIRSELLAIARAGALSTWESDRRLAAWEGLRAAGDTLPLAPVSAESSSRPFHPRPLRRHELIALDYHALGMSLTGHPMERVRQRLRSARVLDSRDLLQLDGGERIIVAGLVTIRQRPESANGTIFLLLEDEHGFINAIASAKKVAEYTEVVKYAQFVLVYGRFERDGDVRNVVGERFEELSYGRLTHVSRDFR
jgi:error-prone DNA polymerase